ncbi:MAG: metal ABC transporter permease [Clostridia bacterium]|nr:metal ABC transporter permease [Clostridia bacterium]
MNVASFFSGAYEKLAFYLGFPFVRYALIAGVLIALCSSLLGVTLVLKRFSFIGDGLSHVAFGAMAIAAVLKMTNNMPLILAVTILCAVLLLRTGQRAKIKGDAAVAMISVGALAIGYLLMNVFPTSGNVSGDVCTTLFGSTSILTLKLSDVIVCGVLSVVVVTVFVVFYNRIFSVTFDEDFARATGTRASLYNLLIAVTVAVVIVLAMNLVGSLLISALVIFPALSAMRVYKSFRAVTVCSAVVSVSCALVGILVSIFAGTPVGSTIVAVDIAVFGAFWLVGLLKKG